MNKRRAGEDWQSSQPKRKADLDLDERRVQFARTLRALNSQFCSWVEDKSRDSPAELWSEGVEDYLAHAKELLAEYADVIDEEDDDGGEDEEPAPAPASRAAAPASTSPAARQQTEPAANGGLKFSPASNTGFGGGFSGGFGDGSGFGGLGSSGSGGLSGLSAPASSSPAAALATPGGFGGGSTALNAAPKFDFSSSFGSTGGGASTGFGFAGAAAAPSGPSSSPPASLPAASTAAASAGASSIALKSSSLFGAPASGGFSSGFGGGGGGDGGGGLFNFASASGGSSTQVLGSGNTGSPPAFSAPASSPGGAAASGNGEMPNMSFSAPPSQPLPSVFSFGGGSSPGGFSFGGAAAAAQNGSAAAAAGAGDDDKPDENPEDKVKVQLDESTAEILFRDNTGQMYTQNKATKKWVDKGKGNLTLRRSKEKVKEGASNAAYVVFTTESGRVLLNASLYKGMSLQQNQQKPNMILMPLHTDAASPEGEGPAMTLVNFRMHSEEEGTALFNAITKHKPS